MNTQSIDASDPQPDRHDPAATSSRRTITRKGAKIAFVVPAVVALKVNVASASAPIGTGFQNP